MRDCNSGLGRAGGAGIVGLSMGTEWLVWFGLVWFGMPWSEMRKAADPADISVLNLSDPGLLVRSMCLVL